MNKDVKELWIKALRSGEYKQSKKRLRTEEGYCCLGVLCDIYSKEVENVSFNFNKESLEYSFLKEVAVLPFKVQIWAGLREGNPHFTEYTRSCLAVENDNGMNFEEIADIIEKHF